MKYFLTATALVLSITTACAEDKTPNQRVSETFEALKSDRLQDRLLPLPEIAISQPELMPEVQAIVEANPWELDHDNCVPFLPPAYAACPDKPIVAEGE